MDKVEMSDLINSLDSAVPKENSHFAIYTYGGGTDESFTQGNSNGYLRFGIEFLKAGLIALDDKKDETDAELGYLINEDSDFHCHYFIVSDEPRAAEYESDWKDYFVPGAFVVCLFLILIMAAIGFGSVVRFLIGQAFG